MKKMQPLKNLITNAEKPAVHEKLELIQSEANRQDDSVFCFIMNQTMNKNASGAITIHNLAASIFLQHSFSSFIQIIENQKNKVIFLF